VLLLAAVQARENLALAFYELNCIMLIVKSASVRGGHNAINLALLFSCLSLLTCPSMCRSVMVEEVIQVGPQDTSAAAPQSHSQSPCKAHTKISQGVVGGYHILTVEGAEQHDWL